MLMKERVMFTGGLFVLLSLCSYLFYHNFLLLLLFYPVYRKGIPLVTSYRKEREKAALLNEFRDFLFSLSATFATGRHLKNGMDTAVVYLREVYGNDSLLADKLEFMCRAIDETGVSEGDALMSFAEETDLEDIWTFADTYCACIETGGNLVQAVDKAAEVIGEKIKLEGEIKTLISQKKFEGRIIGTMPFLMLLFLQLTAPYYLEIMYVTTAGRILMTVALGLNLFTVLWIERMTNIEV